VHINFARGVGANQHDRNAWNDVAVAAQPMHGIGNLAAQIGPYGLAVDYSRAQVRQPISSEQGLARGRNFLQRREQRWAVARSQKALETARRAGDKRDVAWWDADRLGDQSNESSIGFAIRRCRAHANHERRTTVSQHLHAIDGIAAAPRRQPHRERSADGRQGPRSRPWHRGH
jgi:hypothetical protein